MMRGGLMMVFVMEKTKLEVVICLATYMMDGIAWEILFPETI